MTNPRLIYVGSCVDIDYRIRRHKYDCYNESRVEYNFKIYKIIRSNGGFDSFYFQVIDVLITADKSVLRELEQYYIDHFKSLESMNSVNAVTDKAEYNRLRYNDKKDELLVKSAEYRKSNQEKIAEYREKNRDDYNAKQRTKRASNRDEYNGKQRARHSFKVESKRMRSIIY